MKTRSFFREVRNAAQETPRLYFSAVLDIVRFIERMGGSGASQTKSVDVVIHKAPRKVMNPRHANGRSLATSLGQRRKDSKHTNA